jgi:hypothetical protein
MIQVNLGSLPKALYLTEEEAMALLDLCVSAKVEFDDVKEQAVGRLSDMCRNFLRAQQEAATLPERMA